MCVGALLESDVEALVFALPNTRTEPPGQSSNSPSTALGRRIKVVSGIRRDEVEGPLRGAAGGLTAAPTAGFRRISANSHNHTDQPGIRASRLQWQSPCEHSNPLADQINPSTGVGGAAGRSSPAERCPSG